MDCLGGPDVGDDEIPPQAPATKRCKLPKRFFDEVDRSPVPRKVRSGTKKIRRKPNSLPLLNSKRPIQSSLGVKSSCKKYDQKKTADAFNFDKCGDIELLISEGLSGKITRDEAEVVETLCTLAGMLHNRDDNADEMSCSMDKATKGNLMTSPTAEQSPIYSYSGVMENGYVGRCSSTVLEASNRSFKEHTLSETVKIRSVPGSHFLESKEHDLQICRHMDHEKSVAEVNQSTPLLYRAETSDEIFLPKSAGQLSECPEIRLKPLSLSGNLVAPRRTVKENKEKSALWPGLSPAEVPGRKTNGSLLQPSPLRVTASLENGGLIRKEDACTVTEISLKRSERHVHLCRFIQGLQIQERTGSMRIQSHQLRLDTELKQEAFVGINNLNRSKDHLDDAINLVPSDKWLHQDEPGVSLQLPSETLVTQKQKFNFLSLSPGSSRVINCNKDAIDRHSKGLELFPQSSGFYGHTYMQNQASMTLSSTQAYYSSPGHLEQIPPPVSAIQQSPPSLSCLPSASSDPIPQTKTKRHQEQQQQIWASQMAVQSTNWPDPIRVQFLSRPKGRSDPSQAQFDQSIFHNSHSSTEALYGYHSMFTAKQQQFASIPSSLGASGIRTQHHPLPFR